MTIWDKRILRENHKDHLLKLVNETAEYPITDVYKRMANKTMKVYFNYEHMPIVGINYKERFEIGTIKTPAKYKGIKKHY